MTTIMVKFTRSHRVVYLMLLLLISGVSSADYYMDNWCGQTISIGSSGGTLDSQTDYYYDNYVDCTVIISTDIGRRILLTFDRVDIEGSGYIGCSADYLQIYDGSLLYFSQLGEDICGSTIPADIVSSFSEITLRFRTDYLLTYRGFLIAYTSFDDSFSFSSCGSFEFKCDNNRCIDSSLQDNGYDNCGDNSDESSYTYSLAAWIIVAIVIGSIASVVFIALVCYHACCKDNTPPVHRTTVVAPQPAMIVQQPAMIIQQPVYTVVA